MINTVDIILAVLALFYIIKNAGGPLKIVKSILMVLVYLIGFGLVVAFLLQFSFMAPVEKILSESYSIKLSQLLIRAVYPPIKNTAPKVDAFINDKIMSKPEPKVETPKVELSKIEIPKMISIETVMPKKK